MTTVFTKTPRQNINSWGISSQWSGKHTRFEDKDTFTTALDVGKQTGFDHNGMPEYKIFRVNIPYPEEINNLTKDDEDHYLYRFIYEVWCQGFEDGKVN